ncbi:hypothetical protein BMS3Bbin11_01279 [bacterium BMS3Bbin11]|nr:hypothetical protein BMS3Bbin11_01279 [bacterium BMS3Bbin11]
MTAIMNTSEKKVEINLNVLGYKEDKEWTALALEMDLRGFGDTFDKALEDLNDQIQMQISFAVFKNNLDMAFYPAAPTYFALYEQVRQDRMRNYLTEKHHDYEYEIGGLPMPAAHIIKELQGTFEETNSSCG